MRHHREAEAARFRTARDALRTLDPSRGAWMYREVQVQVAAILCRPGAPLGEEHMDHYQLLRYQTDAEYHAWVLLEARVAAEMELARVLGQPVADMDVASFLRERDRLLAAAGTRRLFEEDEEYERAVFVMTLAAVQDAQTGRLSAQLRDLYRIDPGTVSIARPGQ